MSNTQPQLLVTGASGQLGRLVVDQLLATVPAGQVTAVVRSREAAAALAAPRRHRPRAAGLLQRPGPARGAAPKCR